MPQSPEARTKNVTPTKTTLAEAPLDLKRFPTVQFGLLTLLLLTACFGTWFSFYQSRRQHQDYLETIPKLRRSARVLHVRDRNQFVLIKQDIVKPKTEIWKVFVPEGNFQMILEAPNITDADYIPNTHFANIKPGEHEVSVITTGHIDFNLPVNKRTVSTKIQVLLDGVKAFETQRSNPYDFTPLFSKPLGEQLQESAVELPLLIIESTTLEKRVKTSGNFVMGPEVIYTKLWIEAIGK